MRQFLLAGNVAYASGTDLSKVAEGAIGVFYNNNSVPTASATGKEFKKEAMLVLGRSTEKGGPIVLPIFNNNFSYVKGVYQAPTKFSASMTIEAPTKLGDYSIIIVRKGVKFNERNKWTITVHLKEIPEDDDEVNVAQVLIDMFIKQINISSDNHGIVATSNIKSLEFSGNVAGVDYEIIGADNLFGVETNTTSGLPGYGDANYIKDLAEKAAADAGFEYTYRDANYYMYPNYPLNPLTQPNASDTGYTIFTLRFAEPRDVKTRDEVVNQIIQVAFPTGASAITKFETVCKGIAGIA